MSPFIARQYYRQLRLLENAGLDVCVLKIYDTIRTQIIKYHTSLFLTTYGTASTDKQVIYKVLKAIGLQNV